MNEASLHYIDPFSILIIDAKGTLKRLFCPFKVVQVFSDVSYRELTVDMVYKNFNNEVLYLIKGQVYMYDDFIIN